MDQDVVIVERIGFGWIDRPRVWPGWMSHLVHNQQLCLEARVVDFLNSYESHQLHQYLQHYGFDAERDSSCSQIGVSCGIVAAFAAVQLYVAGDAFLETVAHRAIVQPELVRAANVALFERFQTRLENGQLLPG